MNTFNVYIEVMRFNDLSNIFKTYQTPTEALIFGRYHFIALNINTSCDNTSLIELNDNCKYSSWQN